MSLTRSFLKGMQLTDEQVSAIIEAHTETTNALKAQRDEYKADSDKLAEVQNELNELKGNGNDWEAKYNQEHKQFEDFKAEISTKESKKAKEEAYAKMLRELEINEKTISKILQLTDLQNLEMDDQGNIKDIENLKETAKTEWGEFIPREERRGTQTQTPPGSGSGSAMTKEEIMKIKDATERQKAIMENPQLFGF